jgi:O-succinylbenzoic acid--CoA ligase
VSERPWLVERAASTPDAPALALPGRDLSWRELEAEARSIEASLAHQGVRPGDVVAALLGSADFALAVHGIWLRGATVLPLNARLTAAEIAFQLNDSEAGWIVHPGESRAAAALAEAPSVRPLELGRASPASELPAFDPRQVLAILYTSGTTGRPKGAQLTGENFRASARASQQRLGSRPSDRCLACMPLFHVGGLAILVRSVLLGSCVQVHKGFDPEAVANALESDGITDVSFVANMLAQVLDVRAGAPAPVSLRTVLVGGGPIPEPLTREAESLGYPIAATYGLTEATSQVATRAPADREAMGLRPLPGVALRVDTAEGQVGEILVQGPMVMAGYRNREEETARTLRGGWLHTGDVGQLHDDGTLTMLDRRSDLIISGGENIYPAEIESVLLAHPDIAEVGVAGRPDERYGARPVAWYVPAVGATPGESELSQFCRERLAGFKVPVAFVPRDAMPRTAAGKLIRAQLAERES